MEQLLDGTSEHPTTDSGRTAPPDTERDGNRERAGTPWAAALLKWALAIIGAAFIGALFSDWWEAPRPNIELVNVEISPVGDIDRKVKIPSGLLVESENHTYVADLKPEMTIKDLEDSIREAATRDIRFRMIREKIARLIAMLRSQGADLELARREFLAVWSDGDTGTLNSLVKEVLARTTLPENYYRPHPPEFKKRNIELDQGAVLLSEIDEEGNARQEADVSGPVNVYERILREGQLTNRLRRLWIYLEPAVLIPTLEKTDAFVTAAIDGSVRIQKSTSELVQAARPFHIKATALVGNRGIRPLPIRQIALLWIALPEANGDLESFTIPMTQQGDASEVKIVEGGQARVQILVSDQSLVEILESHPELKGTAGGSSRFESLLAGTGLTAALTMAKAGVPNEEAVLERSQFVLVGPASRDRLIKQMNIDG